MIPDRDWAASLVNESEYSAQASGDVDANGDVVSALTDRLRKAIGDTAWPVDPCDHLELVRKRVWQARR